MKGDRHKVETVSLLQDLGLKEYEARCFMTLKESTCLTICSSEIGEK